MDNAEFCELVFNGPFDQAMAAGPVPGVFTLSYEGELGLDVPRTRDFIKECLSRLGKSMQDVVWTSRWQHCVLIDHATGWPQAVLITAEELCGPHSRCTIECYATHAQALNRVHVVKHELFARGQEAANRS